MTCPPLSIAAFLALVVVLAAVFDLQRRRVPNWLTFGGVLIGVGLNAFLPSGAGLLPSLKGVGLALLIYLPLHLLRAIGAGDVKLMAAIGAVVGPTDWLAIFLLTAVIGGLAAALLVVIKGRLRRTAGNIGQILSRLLRGKAPYRDSPELDVRNPESVGLPHGAIAACGAATFLVIVFSVQ